MPSGSRRARARVSSLAITSAAAPSLIPLALPAVTVPPSRNAGLERGQLLGGGRRAGVLVRSTSPTATSSSANRPASSAAAQRCCELERERVLVLARDAVALGDVLAGLAHRLEREHLLHPRVREPPAERRVPDGAVAARERRVSASPSRAARATSTRRRPRRRGRRRPQRPRGRRRRPRSGRKRRAG